MEPEELAEIDALLATIPEPPAEPPISLLSVVARHARRLRAEIERLREQRDKLAHSCGVDLAELDEVDRG